MVDQLPVTHADTDVVEGLLKPRLDIRIDENCEPPTQRHKLLLGFEFGCGHKEPKHPAIIYLQLKPLNDQQLTEAWWYDGEVTYKQKGSVRIAECPEYTVAIIQKNTIDSSEFSSQTRQAYTELINAVRSTKHTRMVKIWNYFDEIIILQAPINLGKGVNGVPTSSLDHLKKISSEKIGKDLKLVYKKGG